MLRTPGRHHLPLGLLLAAGAAVVLHVLGTVALAGSGWAGRAGMSRPVAMHGAPSSGSASLRVRLSTPATSAETVAASGEPADAGETQPSALRAASLIEQIPPAAGGGATFASTYLSSDEIDQGPLPEPGWILDERVLEQVGRARMRLRLWVSDEGRIDRVAVLHAEPPGSWVDEAIRPLPDTRMRPAERDGRPVASTIVVELSADLETLR